MNRLKTYKVILVFASLLGALLIAEVYLRLAHYQAPMEKYENLNLAPQSISYNYHKETAAFLSKDKATTEDHYVVAFIGDSFIYGWRIPEEETIPSLAYDNLKKSIPNLKVLNISKPASNIVDFFLMLDKLKAHKFNQIILYTSNNDQYFINDNPNPFLVCSKPLGKPLLSILNSSKLAYFIYNAITMNSKVMTKTEKYFSHCVKSYYNKVKKLAKSMSDQLTISYFWAEQLTPRTCTRIKKKNNQYKETFKRIFNDKEDIYINTYIYSKNCNQVKELLHEDSYHFNKNGNKIISKQLSQLILSNYTNSMNSK